MLTYSSITDSGNREYNEDSIYIDCNGENACFILADGLGGQGKGDIASSIVVNTIKGMYNSNEYKNSEDYYEKMIVECRLNIEKEKREKHIIDDMMSTVVILIIDKDYISYFHVGDSRLYCFEDNKLSARTVDHSVPQALVAAGEIADDEIRHHQDRNKLLKAIGMDSLDRINSYKKIRRDGRRREFLMCSDGFWEHICEKDMEKALRFSGKPQRWLDRMVKIVRKNGKAYNMDNYTAICVYVD